MDVLKQALNPCPIFAIPFCLTCAGHDWQVNIDGDMELQSLDRFLTQKIQVSKFSQDIYAEFYTEC